MEAFSYYFTNILDATGYVIVLSFIIALFLLIVRKTKNIYLFLLMIFAPIVAGALNLLLEGLSFGLTGSQLIPSIYTGLFFSLSKVIISFPFIYMVNRSNQLNQFLIKFLTFVASLFILNTMSKAFGFFAGVATQDNFYIVSLCRSLPYFLLIITVLVIKKFDINHFKTLSKELVVAIYLTNIVLISIAIYDSTLDEHGLNIIILNIIVSLTLYFLMILIYYALFKVNEYRHKAINHEVQVKLANAKLNSLVVDKVNREEISKMKHDIKNQISYIGLLLEQQKYNEAINYIDGYVEKYSEVLNTFVSPNEVVNSIVNLELTKAKLYNIKIKVKAVIPSHLPFKDIDLCSLVSNILDNAMENCDPTSENPIILSIYKQQDFIRIYCENSVNPNIPKTTNNVSTKKEKGHGYGMKIIKNIAKSYGGYAYFERQENIFITDVLLELGEGMKNV